MGRKAVQADATIVFDDFPDTVLLIKQFPWPVATPGDVVEFFGPIGQKMVQPSQNKTKQEGPVAIYETVNNHCSEFLKKVIESGAQLNATVYAGRPESYTKKEEIKDACLIMDTPDRDWENETQVLICQGTLHFHWFANQ
ncbi:hypothetical protein [Pseudomonas lurida]|uniref:hypothetical protein n=1 Tax=Pseudomonas lurida TaxID=244566 RepID=UPI0017869718|nr:hypothetical protein [Pseudomonas lurida]MBD8671644.1 hypothetical protein [Pseudomonas lurida]